jgi:hypothetical protein
VYRDRKSAMRWRPSNARVVRMSFAALRQTCLRAFALGEDKFAEDVTLIDGEGNERTVRVKITVGQLGLLSGTRQIPPQEDMTFEELELIEVLVSRDPLYAKSCPGRPQPGSALRRDPTKDEDGRKYGFSGQVLFEGDQHAVYLFQRPRRLTQGRRG